MSSSPYGYSAVLADLESLDSAIGSSGLSSAQAGNLSLYLQEAGAADGISSYVYSILNDVVQSGGAAGTTQTAFTSLLGQWFLGTDNPTPLSGAEMVNNPDAALFPTDMATAYQYIDQGYYNGDCWLVAALVETAAVNPTLLQSMIWENANGTYGVRLCAPAGYVYLTVNSALMSNDEGAYSTDGTIWAGLLEKAFTEAQADGISFPMSDGWSYTTDYPNNYDVVSNGGWDEMMEAMTGRQTNYYQLYSLASLEAGGYIYDKITYDTGNGIDVMFDSNSDTNYGLISDHMFAVIGVDQSTGDYIFFNPWGNAETSGDAQFEVTPQELSTLYQQDDEFLAADGNYFFTEATLCHLAGTLILTPGGERPIETLRIGDDVVTRFGGVQRIKWIGEQHYEGRFIARNPDKIPVKFAAGALGHGLPRRDLYLSPSHSLLLDNILVLARDLLNGVNITQENCTGRVSYYNIELEAHDCVLAEGSWSESYADCGGLRHVFHNAASYWALHPYTASPDEPVLCAPRPRRGPVLQDVLARILGLVESHIKPGPSFGYVEQIGDEVTGWAWDSGNPALPLRLHVYAGAKRLLGYCFAHEDRPDVRQAGYGAGRCGFRLRLPKDADPASIIIRRAATGEILPRLANCPLIQGEQGLQRVG